MASTPAVSTDLRFIVTAPIGSTTIFNNFNVAFLTAMEPAVTAMPFPLSIFDHYDYDRFYDALTQ